ncbi:MAG: hypothetical protein ACE5FS_12895, partial [Paracoccaceae bacterium]
LGLPPAFVLSQDQTLKLKTTSPFSIPDTDPGSLPNRYRHLNDQPFLDVRNLCTSIRRRTPDNYHCPMRASFPKRKQKTPPNSEADNRIIGQAKPALAADMQKAKTSNKRQTPRISLHHSNHVKERRKEPTGAPYTLARTPLDHLCYFARRGCLSRAGGGLCRTSRGVVQAVFL